MTIFDRAADMVAGASLLGLGSGRASQAFVRAVAQRLHNGTMNFRGVPTSEETAELARSVRIPLLTLEEAGVLDATVDGADEVDPNLDLIKGYGHALVREKIVAASSRRLIILAGEEKLVQKLGQRGKLPVEVIPFGLALAVRRIAALGLSATVLEQDGKPFVTDNGNHLLDVRVGPLDDPVRVEHQIHTIPGVVDTGLFLGMADTVLIGTRDAFELVEERQRPVRS